MTGRPSIRSPELADAICDKLMGGMSLRAVCREPDMPSKTFVLDWADDDEAFAAQYARARARGWHDRAELAVDNAQTAEDAAKGRLAFDAERWYLGKMLPKTYGDRQVLAGDPEAPLSGLSQDQLDAKLADMLKALAPPSD